MQNERITGSELADFCTILTYIWRIVYLIHYYIIKNTEDEAPFVKDSQRE